MIIKLTWFHLIRSRINKRKRNFFEKISLRKAKMNIYQRWFYQNIIHSNQRPKFKPFESKVDEWIGNQWKIYYGHFKELRTGFWLNVSAHCSVDSWFLIQRTHNFSDWDATFLSDISRNVFQWHVSSNYQLGYPHLNSKYPHFNF